MVRRGARRNAQRERRGLLLIFPGRQAVEGLKTRSPKGRNPVSPEECRDEALRRVRESDRLYEEYKHLPESERAEFSTAYHEVSHLRQTAAVFAALAQ
jgi:hypothetical protein